MVNFSDLVEAGTALARSLGHHPTCPKASRTIPCVCVAGTEQAKALDDWQHLMERLKKDPPGGYVFQPYDLT